MSARYFFVYYTFNSFYLTEIEFYKNEYCCGTEKKIIKTRELRYSDTALFVFCFDKS